MKKIFKPRTVVAFASLALAAALGAARATADEFTLKDGRRISGTIVGYDQDMFRIQTDFGYILIRKDTVQSIRVEPVETPQRGVSASAPSSETPQRGVSTSAPSSTAPRQDRAVPPPHAAGTPRRGVSTSPVSRPLSQPLPAHISDHLDGNNYVNDTFQFAMYKPPDWKQLEGLRREGISAIVALSSPDEQTLLFVDRQVWSGKPVLSDDRVEASLRGTYQDYRQISESPAEVDGLPALRRNFTGVMDGVEWHGISVRVEHGSTVFGIIGLTSAETYEFQQALFDKMVRSFHFLLSTERQGASLQARPKP